MNPKYYFYISKDKVAMLSRQVFHNSGLSNLFSLKPKVNLFGIEVETEISRKALENDDVKALSRLYSKMRKDGLITSLEQRTSLETGIFFEDEGEWFNGLYVFRSHPDVITYFVWRVWNDSLILLVGSPSNIIGEKTVNAGVWAPGTNFVWQEVLNFINRDVAPDEVILSTPTFESKDVVAARWLEDQVNNSGLQKEPIVLSTDGDYRGVASDILGEHSLGSMGARDLSIATLCFKYLARLQKSKIDLVFRLFSKIDFSESARLKLKGDLNIDITSLRSIYIGSPLYTALG